MGTSESEGVSIEGLSFGNTINILDSAHRCSDVIAVVEKALDISMSRNVVLTGVAAGMLEELGKAGWCIIRAEDL